MFTGIITDIGVVRTLERQGDWYAVIATAYPAAEIAIGASVACAGACLTVTGTGTDWFSATISAETIDCTTLRDWDIGTRVNLERSLRIGDELGGHMVSGHVDGVARLCSVAEEGDSRRLVIDASADLSVYIARKGSVAVDGVSLTVNDVEDHRFGVNIIPHTLTQTTLGAAVPGTCFNLEVDMVARYVARRAERLEVECNGGV